MNKINKIKDFIIGLFFIFIGVFFTILSFNYNVGVLSDMGTGFFPILFSCLLIILGLIVILLRIKNGCN